MEMDISVRRTTGVKPDGTFEDRPGAVDVNGGYRFAFPTGGCDLEGCNCSPGFWISKTTPRNEHGEMDTTIIKFRTKKDFDDAKKLLEAVGIEDVDHK